jgi:hypothetical protein
MKKIFIQGLMLMLFSVAVVAQTEEEQEKYRIVTGVRVNPLIVYDFDGNVDEYIRLHAELGVLFKKKIDTQQWLTHFTISMSIGL